jgi:hypothetical protein
VFAQFAIDGAVLASAVAILIVILFVLTFYVVIQREGGW